MSFHRVGHALALVALFSFLGCNCDCGGIRARQVCREVPHVFQDDEFAECDPGQACGGDHFACKKVKDSELHCCVLADRQCNTEADCCPGQTCPAERKKCFDKFLSCDTDADCGDRGDRFCEVWTDTPINCTKPPCESGRCRFRACSGLGECPDGQSCFQGECMADLPCGGKCDSGKACVPSIDRCQDYSTPEGRTEAACPVTCAPGFISTFNDNRNIWDTCVLPEVRCVCAELPALRSNDLGRFSALAPDLSKSQVLVSAYDGQFGDLVVFRYDAEGKLTRTDYVDGVPSGSPTYGPSGARGGVLEPGTDVGRYTDIAVFGDLAYVSYYDATNGDLKLATRAADGSWSAITVDGASADLGLYTSVAVDADGLPAIAYFQRGGGASFDPASCPAPTPTGEKSFITALKLARATSRTPGPSDFTLKTLACQSRPTPPCFGCGQVCADPGTGPSCYAADTTCTGCDTNTETCVRVGATPTCAKKYNPAALAEVVDGVGLFNALAFKGKDAYVAFMKRTGGDGDLFGVRVAANGTAGPLVLLDESGDTGFFPDLKIESTGNVAISYHDFTSRKLKFYFNGELTTGVTPEVIDSGGGPAGSGQSAWVGTDSALAFGGAPGQVFAVYQDATGGDLKIATRTSSWQVLPALRTEGAVGFFADGAFLAGKLFVSHARIRAKLVSGEPRVDNTLLLEQYTP